jgi:outer membrane protein assembly factor BamB
LPSVIRRNAGAIAVDGRIYVGDRANRLHALSSATGMPFCSYLIGNDGDVVTSPAIVPGSPYTVYMAGSWNGILHAISPTCGLQWKSPSGGNNRYSSPAVGSTGTVYIGTSNGILRAVSPAGEEEWRNRVGGISMGASPAIGPDGTIYFGSSEGLSAVDTGGTMIWQYEDAGRISSTPAIGTNGNIYFGTVGSSGPPAVVALDDDMTELWTYYVDKKCYASPAIGADGTIYTACGRKVLALWPNGTLRWEYEIERGFAITSSPAIASDGTLYLAADQVYAFQDP